MRSRKLIRVLLILIISHLNLHAQKMEDYIKKWQKVAEFEKKGLTNSARKEVLAIFNLSVASGNDAQQVKAAMYQMKYRNMVEEENMQANIFYIDTLIQKTKSPVKNILQSMQAELFKIYLENNRYKFYDRTNLIEENSKDIDTWSLEKLYATITSLYKSSLKNDAVIKSTSLDGLDAILQKGKNTRQLRPTLYDLLAHRALEYFMNDENGITKPAYVFILNDEQIFLPVNDFIKIKFRSKDSSSLKYHALILLQDLLNFHSSDKTTDALIEADLIRLHFAFEHGVFADKNKLYEQALQQIESSFGNNPLSAQAMFLRAELYYDRGRQYDPLTRKDNQFDIKKAKEICESAISRYPRSEGGINAENLLRMIGQPSLKLQTEKVNTPGAAFRSLVQYRNLQKLYLRVIKTTKEELNKLNNNQYDKDWQAFTNLNPLKSWNIELPDLKDFQEHSVEIKIDGLPAGTYMILASIDPGFSLSKNIISKQITHISNISFVQNNKDEIYVLNRSNGDPITNATVQIWQQQYNYTTRLNEYTKKGKYLSDKNGYVKLSKDNAYYNYTIQVIHENDELFLDDSYYNYSYNSYENPSIKRTFLFTDRSIYRPGQTVYFKGIVVNTDSISKKSTVIDNYKTSVQLFDVNGQKAGNIDVKSNEYGSYHGSFKLPEGLLNGQFYIKDSSNESVQYFNVEEYKRPKFYTEVKKPEGTYRINDSIKITGVAKAFAGNNIDGARVNFRVIRKIRYPVWWGWVGYGRGKMPYPGSNEEMEITNGETTTDKNGEFRIKFNAIPDETIDKKSQPVFYYEVSADITDINGETRSGSTTVAVSYQMLQLTVDAPSRIAADSLKNITIQSTNLNDLFEKTLVNLTIQKIQSPTRMFRNRFWEMPDQFVMGKDEFYNYFPYDVYADEDQVNKWSLGEKVYDKTDSTNEKGKWKLETGQLEAGWYKIVVSCKDKYGEPVKAEKFLQLSNEKIKNTLDPVLVITSNTEAEPGQKINYRISSAFEKIWLIHSVTKTDKKVSTSYQSIKNGEMFNNEISVTENDRGGMNMSYIFVQHNRVYSGSENFSIPWSNKELEISYETFRDKILPGSEEKWKVKIKGSKAEKTGVEALISMYDASLDQFKEHKWNSLQSLWPILTDMVTWTKPGFGFVQSEEFNRAIKEALSQKEKSYDELIYNGWNENANRYRMEDGIRSKFPRVLAMQNAASVENVVVTGLSKRKASKDGEGVADTVKLNNPQGSINTNTSNNNIQVRKNFNETAFFLPELTTDTSGNIAFSFIIPEALTKWKMMTIAHTKTLASGYTEKTVITQKPLMVQPNAPRFIREGDLIEFSAKLVNLGENEVTGTVQLELFDAATNKSVDGWFKNIFPVQYFTVAAGQSTPIKFPIEIPFTFNSALAWRIKAISKDGSFSDGEESALPVLSNRMLVTETLPLNMRNVNTKNFKFEKLLTSNNSGSLTNHALTVEYTSNPAWYAVQALPFLMEYPYECAEQNFNRYYANVLASYISNSNSKIKAVFEKWKNYDSAALLSNLQKNQELKSVLLQETPWVFSAQNEQEQKKNIALLFDLVRMASEKNKTLEKLKDMQSSNGGFTWFKGGPDDRYITQYIISGIGHLRKLNALQNDDFSNLNSIVEKALPYLDARLKEEYDQLKKYKVNLKNNNLSYTAIQYLYMRSFYKEYPVARNAQTANNYYLKQAKQYWLKNSRYQQAMIALSLSRNGDTKTALAIISSLKENAIYKEEMGMYWKEFATGGYYWYQAPIESQAMMIEAFTDIEKNDKTIDDLKTWLLKQKQTQNWKTTKATAEACYALLLNGSNWLETEKEVTISLGNTAIKSADKTTEAGTGYMKKTIPGEKVEQGMGNINVSIIARKDDQTATTSWGAVYWQYFEDIDKITAAETPLKLVKKLFIEKNSDRGPVLIELKDRQELQVGDKVKVRIELRSDRDMEYIHMKDMRAACMEPVNVISEYKWQGGLGYYETTKDASTNFFISWLSKGTYVFEYSLFVTHTGNFSNGITTIQCMYAPEFTSHSNGIRVNAGEKK